MISLIISITLYLHDITNDTIKSYVQMLDNVKRQSVYSESVYLYSEKLTTFLKYDYHINPHITFHPLPQILSELNMMYCS